jgi:pimeloyl-ACP methyl ester carboxylesterase
MRTLVFPGLDGGTRMLSRFRELAPLMHDVVLFELPTNLSSYKSLADHFADTVSEEGPCCLVAESFSGPLAVMLAAAHPQSVTSLILVASFVTSPVPPVARYLPWSIAFRLPFAPMAAQRLLLGPSCDSKLAQELRHAIGSVSSGVLAKRIRQIMRVDVRDVFRQLQCPIMYLRPSDDAIVPEHCVNLVQQLRPDTVIHTIDGPHLILETQPAEAWQEIAGWHGPVSYAN